MKALLNETCGNCPGKTCRNWSGALKHQAGQLYKITKLLIDCTNNMTGENILFKAATANKEFETRKAPAVIIDYNNNIPGLVALYKP